MTFEIRPASPTDADGIGYVRSTAWKETYTGMIDAAFLADLSPEKCAARYSELGLDGFLVLTADGKVVGFSSSGKTHDDDLPPQCGDIHALYILKEYQKRGLGRQLLDAAVDKLRKEGFTRFTVWVLAQNANAIAFYEKCGFASDGAAKDVVYNTPVTCKRFMM